LLLILIDTFHEFLFVQLQEQACVRMWFALSSLSEPYLYAMGYAVLFPVLYTAIALVFFVFYRMLFEMLMQRQEYEGQTEENMEAALAQVAAEMRRQLDSALAEQRAAHQEEIGAMTRAIAAEFGELSEEMTRKVKAMVAEDLAEMRQEMDTIKGALSEKVTDMLDEVRNLNADMGEMRRDLLADRSWGVRRRRSTGGRHSGWPT
jgi:F0F1-type ATP synthase membrane subunit b/b'